MLLKKLRLAVGVVMVLAALGGIGAAYRGADLSGAARAAEPDKPRNELEALRKENELLKLNLQVVLEKVRAQEGEIAGLRKDVAARNVSSLNTLQGLSSATLSSSSLQGLNNSLGSYLNSASGLSGSIALQGNKALSAAQLAQPDGVADAAKEAEAAVKALREAKDKEGQRKAAAALEKAMKVLKEKLK